jgi:hypothetical protein
MQPSDCWPANFGVPDKTSLGFYFGIFPFPTIKEQPACAMAVHDLI